MTIDFYSSSDEKDQKLDLLLHPEIFWKLRLQYYVFFQPALNTFLDPSGLDAQDEVQEITPPTTTASNMPQTTTASQPPTLREIASGGPPISRDPPRFN